MTITFGPGITIGEGISLGIVIVQSVSEITAEDGTIITTEAGAELTTEN